MGGVEELDERGDQGVGQGQEEYLVDQPVGQVYVLADVEVGDEGHEDGVHKLGNDRLEGVADLPIGPREVPLVVGQPLDCN